MTRRDLRLLPVASGAWAVALLCVALPATAWWCVLGLTGAAVGVVTVLVVRERAGRRTPGVLGLVVVTLACGAAVALGVGFAQPARAQLTAQAGRVVEAVADVSSSATVGADGRFWFEAIAVAVGPPGRPSAVSAPLRIGVEDGEGFDPGARVRVVGETAATDAGERSALVVFAATAEVERPASGVFQVAAEARRVFVDRALRFPEPGAGLLPGLAVGDTRAVAPALDDAMRTSGLSHLTAVSGANCAIVVAAAFWITALCGGGRGLRITVAVVMLAGFVVLVTPEPSVIRAAVMATVGMLSMLVGRPSAGAGVLALCTVAILVADPWLASTPGFALSVVASGALILLAPPLARGLGRWMPAPLALAIAVPLAAQVACGPVIALFAAQQSLVGVAANMLAAPAAPMATVIGLLACLGAPVPAVADLLAAAAWLPSAWIAMTAEVAAALPLAQVLLPAGLGSAAVVAVVGAAVAVLVAGPGVAVLGGSLRLAHGIRRGAVAVLVVVLALSGGRALTEGPFAAATVPKDWSIAACDVGQGDALVVRSPPHVALIDTGPEPAPLADCLRSLGIAHVDLLVLTHFDLDHAGGVDAVRGRVGSVLHGPVDDAEDERLLAALADGGAHVDQAAAGRHGSLGAASWRVLWPVRDSAAFPPGNDAGVVVEFSGGGVPRSLFLADLSAAAQRMLLRTARPSDYAVVKVAHHGSADQEPALYAALAPRVAVISVGDGNDYGHPRAETLDMLSAVDALVLRTDQRGRLLLGLREGSLQVWTQKDQP